MAQISFSRAAYQRPNPNLHCGKVRLAATKQEQHTITLARQALNDALQAETRGQLIYKLSEVHRATKAIIASHIKPKG